MHRRHFIKLSAIGVLTLNTKELQVMTVWGPVSPFRLGKVLAHEHIFTDFSGAGQETPQYNREEAFQFALPYLKKIKASGIGTIIECTPAYIGRDVILLKQLSEASRLHIITNTGYYAAVNQKYLPPHAHTESAQQLAQRWINEYKNGIEGTGIKPGFIKLGVGNAPLTPVERKLIQAAAITHKQTGLKIFIHTGNGEAATAEADLLQNEGIDLEAMIWVHAQNDQSGNYHLQLAKRGCWISLDGYSPAETEKYITFLQNLKQQNLLNKVILSHDDGFAVVNNQGKISFEAYRKNNDTIYTSIQTTLQPALIKAGFSEKDLTTLMHNNPPGVLII
ncbi:phosphotriesterase family protein [Pedobacter faecalis]|uniref:phosphotriesterase family protein n=1 Tax=Pedobacter faecalis TaxID=3041495 RepID=UPI00254FC467|nr:hypothetical protein [Pedobacter sp. ELA7]